MMTIPLNKKQKQLVEKSMDLVPIMIRSMTRNAAYVTEEEQQELCQIGYLAMCRAGWYLIVFCQVKAGISLLLQPKGSDPILDGGALSGAKLG